MSNPQHIVLLRHGETVGQSSIRFHGARDVALSGEGRDQVCATARQLSSYEFDLVISSPLQRAWRSAALVVPGAPIRLEAGFREIDFGRWEGLTREEIEARDPDIHAEWREMGADFVFPEGEARVDFRERVREGVGRVLGCEVGRVLVVAHKGVVRAVVEELAGAELEEGEPGLAGFVVLRRDGGGGWGIV